MSELTNNRAKGGLGALAGMGLLLLMPAAAMADGYSYGHAEISLGLPHGSITVGKTWENHPRQVVVERVTHKLPEPDFDEEESDVEAYSEADVIEEEAVPEEQVIIEKRRPRVAKKVTIIERYEEPAYCERETVVRKVYVEPPCDRTEVIVHSAPRRVVYVPSPTVVVHAPRHVHKVVRVQGHGHRGHGGHVIHRGGHSGHHGGSIKVHSNGHGPRDLYPGNGNRPMRNRGARNLVMVGGHSH